MSPFPRRFPSLHTVVLSLALLAGLAGATSAPARPAPAHAPKARAAAAFLTGIGDEQAEMFGDPMWQQLRTKIARYIAPYDALAHRDSLAKATEWIHAAEAQHVKVVVAFYHSEHTPTRLPSVAQYQHDVQKFIRRFPRVRQYQAWDESNRGNVPHLFSSPSATATAQYYQALRRVCRTCTVIGLDVLDQYRTEPTVQYIEEFKREVRRLRQRC